MQHVMIDLETWGTVAGAALLSLGAVAFDPASDELGSKYYSVINLKSCAAAGLWVEEATAEWWDQQSHEARAVLREEPNAPDLKDVLEGFTEYLKVVSDDMSQVKIYGNGSDFDNALLARAYLAVKLPTPWKFWNNRCYRTLKSLTPEVRIARDGGVHHNALDDAVAQARHLRSIQFELAHGKRAFV